jgi:electron transfer flavoprotein beta subunit
MMMMKIIVPVKRVVDYNVKIRVKPDGSGVDLANVKMSMNPFDEIAVEEALRIKEAGKASEVIVVSIGPAGAAETLRTGLAMGADRGVLISSAGHEDLDSFAIAKVLAALAKKEAPDLIFCGKQGIDADNMHVPVMTAELLGWPHVNVAVKVTMAGQSATVEREAEGGIVETYEVGLPAVIGTHKALNTPRYASLPNIMKAKKKPIEEKSAADYGVDVSPRLTVVKVNEPPKRSGGVKVKTVTEFLDKLAEAGAI